MKSLMLIFVFVAAFCHAEENEAIMPEWTKLLGRSEKVEAILLKDNGSKGLIERTERKLVIESDIEKFRVLFQTRTNWIVEHDGCEPQFAARLVLYLKSIGKQKELETLTVDICFTCNHVSAKMDEKSFGYKKFKPSRFEILALFRKIFPEDKIIEAVQKRAVEHERERDRLINASPC
ncbi:MAG: hypothetical protein ABIV39_14700 [Verrucomicrobiota bacterium]